ncbi:MAG: hypothetical protein HQM14_01725 [SAR324 cluster bacterium]|nr:hypothetical protein [SAR324 cluster bacterium]
MDDRLHVGKQNTNKVLWICVNILNIARSLDNLSFEINMLAKNGSINAARVDRSKGQMMVPLVGGLSDISLQIRTEIDLLKTECINLSRKISLCSVCTRRHYQYKKSLICSLNRLHGKHQNADPGPGEESQMIELFTSKKSNTADSLASWVEDKLSDQIEEVEQINMESVARKSDDSQNQFRLFTQESIRIIQAAIKRLERIEKIRLTAKYVASYISINVAYLETGADRFHGLVENINIIVQQLDEQQQALIHYAEQGQRLLQTMLSQRN